MRIASRSPRWEAIASVANAENCWISLRAYWTAKALQDLEAPMPKLRHLTIKPPQEF